MVSKIVTFSRKIAIMVCLTFGFLSHFAGAAGMKHPPNAVFCQALLSSLAAVPNELKSDPLISLRELQDDLRKSRGYSIKTDLRKQDGYMVQNYSDSLTKPSVLSFDRIFFKSLLARLEQLEADTTSYSHDIARVTVELRGEKAVSLYANTFLNQTNQLNTKVSDELSRRYPKLRLSNAFQYSFQGLLWFGIWNAMQVDDPVISHVFIGVFAFFIATEQWAFQALPRANQQTAYRSQVALAERCITYGCPNSPVSIASGYFEVPTEFHRALLSTNEPPSLELTIAQSESAKINAFDGIERSARALFKGGESFDDLVNDAIGKIKDSPDGPTRELFYDSIFYMDPRTNEPVWLVYYRAIKDRSPPPPKKKAPKEVEYRQRQWIPQGGLAPIAIPAR
jgi:hypothetical protein